MHKGCISQQWDHTATIVSTLANIHRDPKKRRRPYQPADFHPFKKRRPTGIPITKQTIEMLKVFC